MAFALAPQQPSEPPPAALRQKRPRVVDPPQWVLHGVPKPPPPPTRQRIRGSAAEAVGTDLGTAPKAGSSLGQLHDGRVARRAKAEEEKVEASGDEEVLIGKGVALPMTPPEVLEAGPMTPPVTPQVAVRDPPAYVEPQCADTDRAEAMIAAHKQVFKEVTGDRIQRGGWQTKAQVLVDLVANGFTEDAVLLASHFGPRLDREQVADVLSRC